MSLIELALTLFFVVPIVGMTVFGVVAAIMMSDAEKRKVSTNG